MPSSPILLPRTLRWGKRGWVAMCCCEPPIRRTGGHALRRCVEHTVGCCSFCMRVCVCLLCVSLLLWKGVCAMSWPWRRAHSAFFLLDLTTALPNPIPVSHPRATWPTGTHEQSHATLSTTYLSETSALHWGNTLASAVAPSALILFSLMLQEAEKSRLVQVHASARVPGPNVAHLPK